MEHTPDALSVGTHFLEFSIGFLNLAKCQYQQQNEIKAGTLGFHTLVLLSLPGHPSPTMSELAADLGIPKQQLTKLVNLMEEKEFVKRRRSDKNRRLVHLEIAPLGLDILNQLKQDMLSSTVDAFSRYTQEELMELDDCLSRMAVLLGKLAAFASPNCQENSRFSSTAEKFQ